MAEFTLTVTLARPTAVEAFAPPALTVITSKTTAVEVFTPPATLQTIGAKTTQISAYAPTAQAVSLAVKPCVIDLVDGGPYTISGTVKKENTPTPTPMRRRVRLYNEFGKRLVREGWSDATTGAFSFTGLANADKYFAIATDHERYYRAVIVDGQDVEAS